MAALGPPEMEDQVWRGNKWNGMSFASVRRNPEARGWLAWARNLPSPMGQLCEFLEYCGAHDAHEQSQAEAAAAARRARAAARARAEAAAKRKRKRLRRIRQGLMHGDAADREAVFTLFLSPLDDAGGGGLLHDKDFLTVTSVCREWKTFGDSVPEEATEGAAAV